MAEFNPGDVLYDKVTEETFPYIPERDLYVKEESQDRFELVDAAKIIN
jgi:hypothetical protein